MFCVSCCPIYSVRRTSRVRVQPYIHTTTTVAILRVRHRCFNCWSTDCTTVRPTLPSIDSQRRRKAKRGIFVARSRAIWNFRSNRSFLGPILWGHSGPLCHALSSLTSSLWTSMRRRRATVATPDEWQCKTGGVRRLAVANWPNIFQMLLVEQLHGQNAVQKLAYCTKYLRTCWSDLHQSFMACRQIDAGYKTNIHSVIAKGMLLW